MADSSNLLGDTPWFDEAEFYLKLLPGSHGMDKDD
jgi:hypothetical protein